MEEEAQAFNPKETIFEHLGDEYGWKIVGRVTLPLPVIVGGEDGSWHVFSSSRLEDGKVYEGFYIAREGNHEGKVVGTDAAGNEYRPYDFSITKNVFSIMISALITLLIVFSLVRFYRKNKYKAPRKGVGSVEMVVEMLYKEVIVSVLGKEARKYAPYLLTLFFFIFISNLMGLVAFLPGRGERDGEYVYHACAGGLYFCRGQRLGDERILERDILAGCTDRVEMPGAPVADNRDFWCIHETRCPYGSSFREYAGRTLDRSGTDLADLHV